MQSNNSSTTHPLDIYFRHNLWSNLQLFDACSRLDETQLAFSIAGTLGSIHATLSHIISGEDQYIFQISNGEQMAERGGLTAATPLSELRQRVETSSSILLQLATLVDGNRRARVGEGDDAFLIPIQALLLQAIHHGHEHRTQIETMLGQLGIETPGLSAWRYFDEEMA